MMVGVMRGPLNQSGYRLRRLWRMQAPLWKIVFWSRSCGHELLSLSESAARLSFEAAWSNRRHESGCVALVDREDLFDWYEYRSN